MYQNGETIYQIITKLPNGHKIYQMAMKYSKLAEKYTNIFHFKEIKIYKNWFSTKTCHLATLLAAKKLTEKVKFGNFPAKFDLTEIGSKQRDTKKVGLARKSCLHLTAVSR
jgi:hypothetical protein